MKGFRGYYSPLEREENVELTHVEKGSPCGEYLRRFWQPVCYADDLSDVPLRVRILGEDLVVFRDFSGRVGVLELHCPHRGSSLEYGLVSERGIRCCYHGWQFDIDGTILEVPAEPADSKIPERVCAGAFPTHEFNGTIFAYMGPPEDVPSFPMLDSYDRPGFTLSPGRIYTYPCNWLQILENALDPVHTAFLHTIVSGAQFTDEFGVLPELSYVETPIGSIYVATRRVDGNAWARSVEIVLPNIQQVAPIWETGKIEHGFVGPMMTRWVVPIDNTNTMFVEFRHIPDDLEGVPPWWHGRDEMLPQQLPESDVYEESQRRPGDYEAQVSQRPIAVHALENLATSDRGVTMFRRQVKRGIDSVRRNEPPQAPASAPGEMVPTYCNDTVVAVPEAPTPEQDGALMAKIGDDLARRYIDDPADRP